MLGAITAAHRADDPWPFPFRNGLADPDCDGVRGLDRADTHRIGRSHLEAATYSRLAGGALALAVALGAAAAAAAPQKPAPVVSAKGALHVPYGYQKVYEYLGSWAVAADSGAGSKEMHVVYASPGATAAFKRTGHFPDGTVLVKEVREVATAPMTTGTVSHATMLKVWFVVVRDSKNTHPGDPLWGDGWGWSWFDAGKPMQTTSTDYHKDCLGCHQPAKASDWMYSSGYPTLQR